MKKRALAAGLGFFPRKESKERKGFLIKDCLLLYASFFSLAARASADGAYRRSSFLWLEPKKRSKESSRATSASLHPGFRSLKAPNSLSFRKLKQRGFFNAHSQPVCFTLIARGPRTHTKWPVLYTAVKPECRLYETAYSFGCVAFRAFAPCHFLTLSH